MNVKDIVFNSPYWVRQIAINAFGFQLARRRFSGSFSYYFNLYNENLKKSPEAIEEEQFLLLKQNLIFCQENIPYYKRIFSEVGFDAHKMSSPDEIKIIPYLTKDIIRREFDNLINKDKTKCSYKTYHTSGSTGERLRYLLPNELRNKTNTAFLYRYYNINGVKPKDKRVTIGGRIFTHKKPFYAYNYFENQLLLSAHHLNDENIEEYIKQINKFKPVFIQGHPSAILVMAEYMIANKINIESPIKMISTTGETLFKKDQDIIEKAFNTKVYQQYGSGENIFSTFQAEGEEGYLINYEQGYIELIGEDEYKEVIVTSFQNDVMPFVRYKIGDYVLPVEKRFSKKYGLPIYFKEVIGRVDDVIYDTKGNSVLPVKFRMSIKEYLVDGTNFQLSQKDLNEYVLKLSDPHKQLNEKKILKIVKNILGGNANIKIEYVDSLTTKGGKIRNVVNQIGK